VFNKLFLLVWEAPEALLKGLLNFFLPIEGASGDHLLRVRHRKESARFIFFPGCFTAGLTLAYFGPGIGLFYILGPLAGATLIRGVFDGWPTKERTLEACFKMPADEVIPHLERLAGPDSEEKLAAVRSFLNQPKKGEAEGEQP